jgi:hypothetical protein
VGFIYYVVVIATELKQMHKHNRNVMKSTKHKIIYRLALLLSIGISATFGIAGNPKCPQCLTLPCYWDQGNGWEITKTYTPSKKECGGVASSTVECLTSPDCVQIRVREIYKENGQVIYDIEYDEPNYPCRTEAETECWRT